jgi:hypothetical protein
MGEDRYRAWFAEESFSETAPAATDAPVLSLETVAIATVSRDETMLRSGREGVERV